jgi:hypothetical protein
MVALIVVYKRFFGDGLRGNRECVEYLIMRGLGKMIRNREESYPTRNLVRSHVDLVFGRFGVNT